MLNINIQKISDGAFVPTQVTPGSAGYDLYSAYDYVVEPQRNCLVKTDIKMDIPQGYYGRIAERSGLSLKKQIKVGGGVIDSDYRGNVGIILFNFGDEIFEIKKGDRVAQIVFEKAWSVCFNQINELSSTTKRNESGFGSSGTNFLSKNSFEMLNSNKNTGHFNLENTVNKNLSDLGLNWKLYDRKTPLLMDISDIHDAEARRYIYILKTCPGFNIDSIPSHIAIRDDVRKVIVETCIG